MAVKTEPQSERERWYRHLVAAAGGLAQGSTTQGMLQGVCDTLVDVSRHVLGAWLYTFSSGHNGEIEQTYTAGLAPDFLSKTRKVADFCAWLTLHQQGEHRIIGAWLGPSEAPMGALGVVLDHSDYVDRVGADPLELFGKTVGGLLGQARLREQLRAAAEIDELTGLLNRSAVRAALKHVHARAERENSPYAILLFDLDGFKIVNDHYGHLAGDKVLVNVAHRLRHALRDGDWIGRWGGDEFLAVLPDIEVDEALSIADRACALMRARSIPLNDAAPICVTGTVGLACYPVDEVDPPRLIGLADAALYEAKQEGRDTVRRPTVRGRRLHTMAGRIAEALEYDRIRPAFQPIVDLSSGKTIGYEALARLVEPGSRPVVVDADEFIEVASLRHLIHHIDFRMFRAALHHCEQEREHGTYSLHFINISAGLLRQPDMIASLAELVARQRKWNGRKRCPIVLEITERDFVDSQQALAMLEPLIGQGARLALDDFGSGYASFRYLADLPVEFLKIEGLLVRQAASTDKCKAIVRGIRDVADELGVTTLAEGIEDAPTADLMQTMGIGLGQGRYFSAPLLAPGQPAMEG